MYDERNKTSLMQDCIKVKIGKEECCFRTTAETIDSNQDIDLINFPVTPKNGDTHIVQFNDSYVIYEYIDSWNEKINKSQSDTLYLFQVGIPLATHIHYAPLTYSQAQYLIHNTTGNNPVADESQPFVVITTELNGNEDAEHTHDLTIYFDYENHTFIVTNITNNDLDNHEAHLVGGSIKPTIYFEAVGEEYTGTELPSSTGNATGDTALIQYLNGYIIGYTWYVDEWLKEVEIVTPPYKVYRALISQEDTDNPTAIVLENTIGNIVWTRSNEGQYIGTLADAFTPNKTFTNINNSLVSGGLLSNNSAEIYPSTASVITLNSFKIMDGYEDDYLINTPIEILVYP